MLNRLQGTRRFHRRLYATELMTITLLKRGDDQDEGSVTSYQLFMVRRSITDKSGQALQNDMSSRHHATFAIPKEELDRVGVDFLNVLDDIIDADGWAWRPESPQTISNKLFQNRVNVECQRRDPLDLTKDKTVYLLDYFVDVDGTIIDNHKMDIGPGQVPNIYGWIASSHTAFIQSNRAQSDNATGGVFAADAGHADMVVQVLASFQNPPADLFSGMGLIFRTDILAGEGSGKGWVMNLNQVTNAVELWQQNAGVLTQITSVPYALDAMTTYLLTAVCEGPNIDLYVQGRHVMGPINDTFAPTNTWCGCQMSYLDSALVDSWYYTFQEFVCVAVNVGPLPPPPSITTPSLPNGSISSAYNQQVFSSGGVAPVTFSVLSGTIPAGLSFSSSGLLAGTPTTQAVYNFVLEVTDSHNRTGTRAYSVSIAGAPGIISGIPTTPGTYTFTVEADDTLMNTGTRTYTIVVAAALAITTNSLPAGVTGTLYNQTIATSGGTAPITFTKTSGTLPPGVALSGAGVVSGTPTSTTGSPFSFTAQATDSLGQTASKTLSIAVTSGGPGGSVLSADAFTLLGSWFMPMNSLAGQSVYCKGLTHRYVGSELRLLTMDYGDGHYDCLEFTLPAAFANISGANLKNKFLGQNFWGNRVSSVVATCHFDIFWEDQSGGTGGAGRMFSTMGPDYPQQGPGFDARSIASAVMVRNLSNSGGVVTNLNGIWGYQNVSCRCVMGGMGVVPGWFQALYGLSYPYVFGFGGYSSLINQGGTCSLGLVAILSPDPSGYTSTYPIESWGLAPPYNGSGDDWSIPTSDYRIGSDHRSGSVPNNDWYTSYTTPSAIPYDRGVCLTAAFNYYDKLDATFTYNRNPTGFALFTNGSVTVTFANPQTLKTGDIIATFPDSGGDPANSVYYTHAAVVAAGITNQTSVTLTAPYTGANANTYWAAFDNPATLERGISSGNGVWQSPAPDGRSRWPWGNSYFGAVSWVDGLKTGIVGICSASAGKAFYGTVSGNFLISDDSKFEIHVFDPADIAAAALGTKNPWLVQPVSMRDITADFHADLLNWPRNTDASAVVGATFDGTTNTFYILVNGCYVGGVLGAVILAYSVNMT